jgi:hypothetical protein
MKRHRNAFSRKVLLRRWPEEGALRKARQGTGAEDRGNERSCAAMHWLGGKVARISLPRLGEFRAVRYRPHRRKVGTIKMLSGGPAVY